MSIGMTNPTTIADITITQSRFENLNKVWHKNPKNNIIKTTISCPISRPIAISRSANNLLLELPMLDSKMFTKPRPCINPKNSVAKNKIPTFSF